MLASLLGLQLEINANVQGDESGGGVVVALLADVEGGGDGEGKEGEAVVLAESAAVVGDSTRHVRTPSLLRSMHAACSLPCLYHIFIHSIGAVCTVVAR